MIADFFNILLPQGCLIMFIIIQLLLGIFMSPRSYKYARFLSLVGLLSSAALLITVQTEPQYFGFKNSIMSDSYTLLFHFIILFCGVFVVLLTKKIANTLKQSAFTFHALILTAIFGAMNIVSANDFLTLFISIELLSFPTYFLISAAKGYPSKEAAFKYLITNIVSTGVFLFGVSYLYGITSSLNFSEIYEIMAEGDATLLYSFAGVLIVFGLIAKLSVFPFANWVIDVFKGTESSVLGFLSTIPKIAMFGILCRILVFPLSFSFELPFVIAIISLITAVWANTYAIREKDVKVILACSTSANASYMLLVACLVSVYNLSTVIFYLICYVIMNLAVFAFLNITEYEHIGFKVANFKGLFHKNYAVCIAYAISVVGLAGIPITSGFVAKIYLFSAIVNSGLVFIPFLLALLILMVVALFYYLKLILPLFDKTGYDPGILKTLNSQKFVLYITTAITILLGIYPEKIIELCKFVAYNV